MDAAADEVAHRLAARGTSERAPRDADHLKSSLHHLGVPVPFVPRTVKEHSREVGRLDHDELVALVDTLATRVVGSLRDRSPGALDPVLRRWATDTDVWLRRSALLAHLVALREGGLPA